MREIKFRGYDPDTKRWYVGGYARIEQSTPYPMSQTPEADAERFEKEQVKHYIIFTEDNDWGLETRKLQATIDPTSVGQFTGLRDKRGVEIFEGDIVTWKVGSIKCVGVVQWGEASWNKGVPGHNMQGLHTYQKSTEIIGKIYENPELLKGSGI